MKTSVKSDKGIITKTTVSVPATLRNMAPGDEIYFQAAQTVAYPTAAIAVRRANQDPRYGQYNISTEDNGASFTIKRIS